MVPKLDRQSKNEQMVGIFTTNESLIINSWDDGLAQITGIPADDARGKALTTIVSDIESRGLLKRFERVLADGVIEVLAPTFHHYLLECPPQSPSKYFDKMQQRVTIAPLREGDAIIGMIVTVEDVTSRLDRERELGEQMESSDEGSRLRAARTLSEQDKLDSTKPLMGALGDESWQVRRLAVDGLAKHGIEDAIKTLLRVLREQHRNLSTLNSALQVLTLSGVDAIAALVECLNDDDADLRIYAAQSLGDQHDPRAIAPLLAALQDPNQNVRYHAIEALGKLRATEAVDALVTLAESGDFYVAFPALDALIRIEDSRVTPSLVPLLEDEILRVPAAEALGHLGDEDTLPSLVGLLNKPGAPALVISRALAALHDRYEKQYREGAYIAELVQRHINEAGEKNLLDALNAASDEGLRPLALVVGWLQGDAVERTLANLLGRTAARKEVVEAMVRYGARITELVIDQLHSKDLETRQAAVIALGRIGDARAVPRLVDVLTSVDELVIPAAGALAKIGDRGAFEALLGLIGHPQNAIRQAVIAGINSIGHPEMAKRAVTLLQDSNPHVRESAVKIAGYFGYSDCIELLIERCRDKDEGVRRAAVEHIPYLDDDRAISILGDALNNGTGPVRASAAQALAQVDSPQALSYLLAALNDKDTWVRYFAARSIGRHGYSEAVDALAPLAQSDSAHHVRVAALESLAQIGGTRAVAILAPFAESENSDLAKAAIGGLGLIGLPEALPPLQAVLRSVDSDRRIDALRALGHRGGADALESIRWVAAADDDRQVVEAAVSALVHLGTPEAIDALITLTSDPRRREASIETLAQLKTEQIGLLGAGLTREQTTVRRATVEVLGRMKQPEASDLLARALDDPDSSVRLVAANALAHLGSRSAERKLVRMARSDPDPTVRRAAQRALQR